MTKKEFKKEIIEISNIALKRTNEFLSYLDLSLSIDWEYDNWDYNNLDNAIGVYEAGSVFDGNILIGFNVNNLYKYCIQQIKNYPWSDQYTIIDETIQTNVFHEMGHGIVEMFNDYLQETDDLDELYDNNKELFDWVLDNEEDAVEEFAWAMYDNQLENSKLYNIIQLYANMFVNENIIRNALNESIDEFLLEEGAFDGLKNWWNNSTNGQKVKNGLSNVWNGIKNGVAMYMDKQTNGEWNNKYGIYANGNGKTTELYYLNKWFNTHLENIRKIEYRNNTPNADFSKSREYVERNGEKVYTDTEIQEKDINTYVQKNITPQNFNNWVGNFIKDRQALELIDNYILECQRSVNDLQSAMKWLNTGSFLADANTGQIYIKTRNTELEGQRQQYYNKQEADKQKAEQEKQEQYKQQQQQILNDAYTMIDAWSKYIASINAYKNGLIRTKTGSIHWTNSVLGALSNTNGMPNEIKQWMDSVIAYNIYNSPKNVAQKITYGEFINSKYGEKYKEIDEWLKKQK